MFKSNLARSMPEVESALYFSFFFSIILIYKMHCNRFYKYILCVSISAQIDGNIEILSYEMCHCIFTIHVNGLICVNVGFTFLIKNG